MTIFLLNINITVCVKDLNYSSGNGDDKEKQRFCVPGIEKCRSLFLLKIFVNKIGIIPIKFDVTIQKPLFKENVNIQIFYINIDIEMSTNIWINKQLQFMRVKNNLIRKSKIGLMVFGYSRFVIGMEPWYDWLIVNTAETVIPFKGLLLWYGIGIWDCLLYQAPKCNIFIYPRFLQTNIDPLENQDLIK